MRSTTAQQVLLRHLADGRFHSGQSLATELGVSRTAVWKQVQRLQNDFGVAVQAVRGRGYRLSARLELLDEARIRAQVGAAASRHLEALNLITSTSSTNSDAAADPPAHSGRARAWLAEHQSAGRGRRGRDWIGGFGDNIALSLAWRFDMPMSALSALSLAAGVAVAETLHDLGVRGHALKWPNDVLADGRKLAGILVEVAGEAGGPATAIVGIGINRRLTPRSARSVDQPWTDLTALGADAVSRNVLAGKLVDHLIDACRLFSEQGIAPFRARWQAFDSMLGRVVRVHSSQRFIDGVYVGIADSGALILETRQGRSEHHAGEVSLREADTP